MAPTTMILAGDVGGTKTLLEVGTLEGGHWLPAFGARYAAADYPDLHGMLREFLRQWTARGGAQDALTDACFGVAGPAFNDRAQMTNLPWIVDGGAVAAEFGIPRVRVVNDFAAAASGVALLEPPDLVVLQAGEPVPEAPRLVIGAGTGLGVACLIWADGAYQVVGGEGGHAGFAPATPEQVELWRDLHARHGRVTLETVVSGPGLVRVYEFVERAAGRKSAHAEITPAAIVRAAVESADATSLQALDLFISCYGAAAGDFALAVLARGGAYVAGGIAPRIIARLQAGGFLAAFNDKASHAGAARKIPVSVVTNDRLGVLGCALIAARC